LFVVAGMYGLLAYIQVLRRKEIGVRMALGADPSRVARMVLGDAWRVSLGGIAGGLAAAWPAAGLLRGVVVGTESTNPWTIAVAIGLILAAATAAAVGPAVRAARVEPLVELRRE
jgi:ABC-type antimicrobial peptide transport system permease subunit